MARTPKLRINFDSDMQYLLRLKMAIEEDTKWPEDFRNEVIGMLVPLIRRLTTAPTPIATPSEPIAINASK